MEQTARRLTTAQRAAVANYLAIQAQEKGPIILGAQLGLLVSQALAPHSMREFGGLKALVASDLEDMVSRISVMEQTADTIYQIHQTATGSVAVVPLANEPRPVAGADLWRFFSNPNADCRLLVNGDSQVFVTTVNAPQPDGMKTLTRMQAEEYRELAKQFAAEVLDVASALAPILQQADYYTSWITKLRELRTPNRNLLAKWESLRAEHVAQRLHDRLQELGVEAAKAAEIILKARPIRRPQPSATVDEVTSRARYVEQQTAVAVQLAHHIGRSTRAATVPAEPDQLLRRMVHAAVDQMSIAELRELRISAGLLYDALGLDGKA